MKVLEKTERRLGDKLFLKGDRCVGPKCAAVRRAYPPGVHGKSGKRRRESSEYGSLLKEKQKVRFAYGLDDTELKSYISRAVSVKKGVFGSNVLRMLERRLDNAVYRLGFASSRRLARQAIVHGHVTVNGRAVRAPSYDLRTGDVIGLKERALKSGMFADIDDRLKSYNSPSWLQSDKTKKTGMVAREPEIDEAAMSIDIIKIKEFYSR